MNSFIKLKNLTQLPKRTLNTQFSEEIVNMDLKSVVEKLNFFAPLRLAESWDNVGLLIEPHTPR